MKKVIVVSKTHLDLGFTDYAENIRQKYINKFIPEAVDLANEVNTQSKKLFIWTTGSWIIKQALDYGSEEQKKKLKKALKNGNIVPHAMPFTTHTELLDEDTLNYGLSIVDELDEIRGKKTVSAKMTDVPGHTKAIVPLLAMHGIKFLHIGVNGVSAVPEVPECFLWKCGNDEIVVVYSGDYGGAFKSDLIDEVLYFDHTLDNHGAPSPERVKQKLDKIQQEFPGYEVEAGTLDEFTEVIWNVRDKLPVFEGEIGDTWIHGSAADPYKSACLRELMSLKAQWLADGSMKRDSEEYRGFCDNLLCIAEHTCGMDTKTYFADYESYLKPDFQKARKKDKIKIRRPFSDFPYNILNIINKLRFKSSYSIIEKSWSEQREYISKALSYLNDEHKAQAEKTLDELRPRKIACPDGKPYTNGVSAGDYTLEINEYGGIKHLSFGNTEIIKNNDRPLLEYRSYTHKDYDFWFEHYARNMKQNAVWGYPDFGRPLLKCAYSKYPHGSFFYKMKNAVVNEENGEALITVNLECDKKICDELGAPRIAQLCYVLTEQGLRFSLSWFDKDASRLTEAIFLHLYPSDYDFKLVKIGEEVGTDETVSMGGKNLNAVQKSILKTDAGSFDFVNSDCPLISIGKGKILEYDNRNEDIKKDGVSYVLYDNVWGTNFPLWYEENARFSFEIKPNEEQAL